MYTCVSVYLLITNFNIMFEKKEEKKNWFGCQMNEFALNARSHSCFLTFFAGCGLNRMSIDQVRV